MIPTRLRAQHSRPVPWMLAVCVGVALILTAVIMRASNVPAATEAGSLPTAMPSAPAVSPAAPSARRTHTLPPGITSVSRPLRADTTVSAISPTRASPRTSPTSAWGRPATLTLTTVNVAAPVDKIAASHGVLQVPDNISRLGWWENSAPAGSPTGTTIIDGHIDSASAGEGALFHLAELNPGDPITVSTSTARIVRYRVRARRIYPKAAGLPAELFDQQGPPRLIIISCSGPFDYSLHSYRDNLAIFAIPVSGP